MTKFVFQLSKTSVLKCETVKPGLSLEPARSTSRTLEAALGTAVEAGQHGGTRRGNVSWRSPWSCFGIGESRPYRSQVVGSSLVHCVLVLMERSSCVKP